MPRKQYGLKFDSDDVERWDDYAEMHGLTRTTLIETAVERFISATTSQAPPTKPAESQPEPHHAPRAGVRRAYICIHKDCNPPRRTFLRDEPPEYVPSCKEHGPMVRQVNMPYMGQSTEPPKGSGIPEAREGVERREEAMARAKERA